LKEFNALHILLRRINTLQGGIHVQHQLGNP